jgi:hypothetical protein
VDRSLALVFFMLANRARLSRHKLSKATGAKVYSTHFYFQDMIPAIFDAYSLLIRPRYPDTDEVATYSLVAASKFRHEGCLCGWGGAVASPCWTIPVDFTRGGFIRYGTVPTSLRCRPLSRHGKALLFLHLLLEITLISTLIAFSNFIIVRAFGESDSKLQTPSSLFFKDTKRTMSENRDAESYTPSGYPFVVTP